MLLPAAQPVVVVQEEKVEFQEFMHIMVQVVVVAPITF